MIGGIYYDRLLVKPNANNIGFDMPMEKQYDGAKPMYLIKNIDDREKTC